MRVGFVRFCKFSCLLALMFLVGSVQAEPSSPTAVKIVAIRPYVQSYAIYIQVDSEQLCNTSLFRLYLNEVGGKEAYAAALTAVATGKKVILEVSNTKGCTGWGTELQSIILLAG